jgi:hypothetical protein
MAFFGPQYVQAAGVGCMVELRLRLAIDTATDPQNEAYDPPLADILKVFEERFSEQLHDGEMQFLERAVTLRNRIAHANFMAAHKIARELGANLDPGGVWQASLLSETIGPVAGATKKGGRNFGWFLEAGNSGLFTEAVDIFVRALLIIDRVR